MRIVSIEARPYWNDTGIDVERGAVYACLAEGRWWDLYIPSGPDGYDTPWWSLAQRLATGWRRLPTARWFALCGAIDEGRPFVIGSRAWLRMPPGRLRCFANDVPGFYWNNFGTMTLRVERVK